MKKYSHYKVISISRYNLDPENVKKLRKEGRVSHKGYETQSLATKAGSRSHY